MQPTFFNIFLVSSTGLSNLVNIICSTITLVGLLSHRENAGGLKVAIVILSTSSLLLGLVDVLTFPIYLSDLDKTTFLLGEYYPDWLNDLLARLDDLFYRQSMTLLGAVFIYRTMIVINPNGNFKWKAVLCGLIGLATPLIQAVIFFRYTVTHELTCDFWCFENDTNGTVLRMTVDSDFGTYGQWIDLAQTIVVTIICIRSYRKINKFFRKGEFSERTKQLQKRLNKGMLVMIAVHFLDFYPIVIYFALLVFTDYLHVTIEDLGYILVISQTLVDTWQIPLLSVVILVSVRNSIKIGRPFRSSKETSVITVVTRTTKV